MADNFTNIHFHTDSSVLDGAATVTTMLDAVQAKNQNSCSITDHGSLSGNDSQVATNARNTRI